MSLLKGPDPVKALVSFRPDVSALKIILKALQNNGQTTAIIEGQTGKSASFQEVVGQATSIAAALVAKGVTAEDAVVLCCDKSILAYSLLLGTMFSGATAVLYPTTNASIIHELTAPHEVKAVFYDPQYEDQVTSSVTHLSSQPSLVVEMDPMAPTMASFLFNSHQFSMFEVKDVNTHIPVVLFSSGTTGEPKGTKISDIAVQGTGARFSKNPNKMLVNAPFYWTSSFSCFLTSIYLNFPLILTNDLSVKETLEVIEKHQVEALFTSTASMTLFVNEPSLKNFDLQSLKMVVVGGELVLSSVSVQFVQKVLGGNQLLVAMYATTEAANIAFTWTRQKLDTGACGALSPGVEIKIADDDGKVVPIGNLGQLWVKSTFMSPGYWGRHQASKPLDDDGFFYLGDVGFFDEEGKLHLRGRAIDLINFKGTKVPPSDIEDVLLSHPDVTDAAVVAQNHPDDIQHPTAYVVKKTDSTVTEAELQSFVDGKVEESRRLRAGVHFVEALPRVSVGKVRRKLLREHAAGENVSLLCTA